MKRARKHASRLLRTPAAVALLCTGAACVTALLIFAPEDVRAWLLGPSALAAVTTIAGLFVRLRGDAPVEERPTTPPSEEP